MLILLSILPTPQVFTSTHKRLPITQINVSSDTEDVALVQSVIDVFKPAIFPKGASVNDTVPFSLSVQLDSGYEYEQYQLKVTPGLISITVNSLEKLSLPLASLVQLISAPEEEFYSAGIYTIQDAIITDKPASDFRAIKVDSATHFLPASSLKKQIIAASLAKMNVMNIIIGNTYAIAMNISELKNASYYTGKNYLHSPEDIKGLVDFGSLLGVSVVFELDLLTSANRMFEDYPDVVANCNSAKLLNPLNSKTYDLIEEILAQIVLDGSKYVHLGNKVSDFTCWKQDGMISRYIQQRNMTYGELHKEFTQKVTDIVKRLNPKTVVIQYQEALDNQIEVELIEAETSYIEAENVFHSYGFQLALTQPGKYRFLWQDTYLDFLEQTTLRNCAFLDGLFADEGNIDSRIWPRTIAVSQVSWTGKNDLDKQEMREFSCSLRSLGVRSGTSGAGKPCMGE